VDFDLYVFEEPVSSQSAGMSQNIIQRPIVEITKHVLQVIAVIEWQESHTNLYHNIFRSPSCITGICPKGFRGCMLFMMIEMQRTTN
jgi:hypothetical protein